MKSTFFFALFISAFTSFAQDHGHLNVGANGTALTFDNGRSFGDPYVKTLVLNQTGKYSNLYSGNITLTALHSTDPFGVLNPNAPKPGSFVVVEIVSVEGPDGGAFQFWETNSTTAPAVSIPSGTTNAEFRYDLSDASLGAGQPGGDAYGHIHGRQFAATIPGIYTVGFQAYDVSTNGPNGAPLQAPSPLQLVHFQAGVMIRKIEPDVDHSHITFGATAGYTWQLQAAASLANPNWKNTGDPVTGDDTFQEIEDDHPVETNRFFRVVGTLLPP
jgi:hypothetical protein